MVLTSIGFLPAATVLSAVPPAVVKLQLRDLASTGTTVGRLSAYGTAGAIVATFLTGFVLVAIGRRPHYQRGRAPCGGRPRVVDHAAQNTAPLHRCCGHVDVSVRRSRARCATALDSPCDAQTTYYCVKIEADGARSGGRTLVLDDLRHSYVDLDDPTHLEFWYTRRFADVIDRLAPRNRSTRSTSAAER